MNKTINQFRLSQRELEIAIAGLPRTKNISDDIFVGVDTADPLVNIKNAFRKLSKM